MVVLFTAGCVPEKYDFPVVDEQPRAGHGEFVHSVCEDAFSGNRVYLLSSCGIDSCELEFYNADGELIEKGGEGMVAEPVTFKTEVINCKRTTEKYFFSKTGRLPPPPQPTGVALNPDCLKAVGEGNEYCAQFSEQECNAKTYVLKYRSGCIWRPSQNICRIDTACL